MSPIEKLVLKRIKLGLIRFAVDGDVEMFKHRRWYRKLEHQHVNGVRRAFYMFHLNGNNCRVYKNRLIWMLVNKRAIPRTKFVDHRDLNRHNDSPDNLQLMKVGESHKQGGNVRADLVLEKLCRWFQFVGEHLREPETEHEILYVNTGF